MGLSKQQINGLIEAQYHYFESREPEKAAEVVGRLMEPMYDVGRYAELLLILEKTINTVEQVRPDFFIFHARSLSELGRHEQALAEIAVVELEVADDPERRAAILIDRANFMRRAVETSRRAVETSQRAEEIIGYYRQAYDIYARLILPFVKGGGEDYKQALSNMASCIFDEGAILQYFLKRPAEALERYRLALSVFENVGDADGVGVVYKQAGEIYGSRGFPEMYNREIAAPLFEHALSIFRENYLPRRMLETLYQMGRLFRRPYQAALEKFREYLEIAGELQLSREQAIAKRHIAELTYLLHKEELAERGRPRPEPEQDEQFYISMIGLAEEAARVLRVLEFDAWSRRALANCHYLMGRVYLDLGKTEQGLEQFKRSLEATQGAERFAGTEDVKRRVLARLRIIQVLIQTGGTQQLEQLYLYFEDMRGMVEDFNRLDVNLAALTEDPRQLEWFIGQLEAEE